ncbi:hypothetical protein F2Q70_00043061 [Brassica cretica]|uniref:Uncharacterized protein n=1 Tax=Brassica cretica TaxID=69181 RepID=A0A8S9KK40_BRACR|nr:hypothetical protein F2Q70_00043061 [Brassica cretica]
MDTLQLAQTFSVSALSIDDETFTLIDRDAMISIDYAVYMSIDPQDRGGNGKFGKVTSLDYDFLDLVVSHAVPVVKALVLMKALVVASTVNVMT